MNSQTRYTRTAVALHWLVALGMIVNVVLSWCLPIIGDDYIRFAIDTHKSIGITVLGLALLRLLWRFRHAPPVFPKPQAVWEKYAAKFTHFFLYGLILLLPLSGWLHDSAWKDAESHPMYLFNLVYWPRISAISTLDPVLKEELHTGFGLVHEYLGFVLYALFLLHVAAALNHQFSKTARVRGRGMLPD